RSSWLSREAVASVMTYPVAFAFGIIAWRHGESVWTRAFGVAALAASIGTVHCTAMIYASLKPIRQWHNVHTAPDYLLYAVFSGALLFAVLRTAVAGVPGALASTAAVAMTALAFVAKSAYWRHIDSQKPLAT